MQGTQRQPKLQFDYWVYSTNAGNGTTSQYPIIPTNKTEMDNLFNSSNSNTTLTKSGRTNSAKILDWTTSAELSGLGITLPNSGNYFAMKIQGTFIPLETELIILLWRRMMQMILPSMAPRSFQIMRDKPLEP